MISRVIISLCVSAQLSAATLYVSTSGSDTRTYAQAQSPATPWRTLTNAAAQVAAGDTVSVAAGTYTNHATLTRNGTSANPIRWVGAGDTTIVQPSVDASSGWVVHSGPVYKHTDLPFTPSVLIADGKYVMRIVNVDPFATTTKLNPTGSYIGATKDAVWTQSTGVSGPYWDGVEAAWDYTNGVCYVRFADDSDANTHSIRIADNGGSEAHYTVNKAPFYVNADYQHISGFAVRHGHVGIYLAPGAYGCVVESNTIDTCWLPVEISGASNYVSANTLWHNFFPGNVSGAYSNGLAATWESEHIYLFSKEYSSPSLLSAQALAFYQSGSSNVVTGNILTNVVSGISCYLQGPAVVRGMVVSSNAIYNTSSVGMALGRGNSVDEVFIHDNLFVNNHAPMRMQYFKQAYISTNTQSRSYWYRNTAWSPVNRGSGIYFHAGIGNFVPEAWFYHNSFEGSQYAILIASGVRDYGSKVRFLNNIIGSPDTISPDASASLFTFDYNLIAKQIWVALGSHNVLNSPAYEWGGSSASTSAPDFLIDTNSLAWNAGTNLTGLSLQDNRTVDAGMWDIGAHEFIVEEGTETPPVTIYFTPQDVGFTRNLHELGPSIELQITRHTDDLASPLSGTWTWSGDLIVNVDYTVTDNDAGTADDHLNWTIPAGDSFQTYVVTAIPDGVYTGPRNGQVEVQPGSGYTPSGGPAYFVWVDAQQPPGVTPGPERPGQFRPPHTLP